MREEMINADKYDEKTVEIKMGVILIIIIISIPGPWL